MVAQLSTELPHPAAPVETAPGHQPALKRPTFFRSRDRLDAALDAGELVLTGPQNAVFRYLLEHAVYDPRKHAEDYGRVVDSALGIEVIMGRTGLKRTATKGALTALEDAGMISRTRRPILTGGKKADLIWIDWLLPKGRETTLAGGSADDPYEGPGDDPSSYREEEADEETSSSRADARDDDADISDREDLAGWLGIPAEQAARVGWNAVALAREMFAAYGLDVLIAAARQCGEQAGTNPVGYFYRSGESLCAQIAAEQQEQAQAKQAAAERQRLAEEIEAFLPQFEAVSVPANFFRSQVKSWRNENCLSDEQILDQLPRWLEKITVKHVEQAEHDNLLATYAEQFWNGNEFTASRELYPAGMTRADKITYMRAALAQGTKYPKMTQG
jgi:hypothetical protein